MSESLLKMREDAIKDGIYLVFLSGYRSINLQKEIFYSLKSIRNQIAAERAKVSAPPGYSEHSTGFAIDIGDADKRETDFEVQFEHTDAFRWRIYYAAVTTTQLIDCYRELRKARLRNGPRPQVITAAPNIACFPRDGVRRRTPHGSSETARPNSALIRARIDSDGAHSWFDVDSVDTPWPN